MSREIKFRAWTGKEIKHDVIPFQWDFVLYRNVWKCTKSNGSGFLRSGGTEAKFELTGYAFQDLMQYTGLKDNKGREIYEGDIVHVEGVHETNERYYEVRYFMGSPVLADGFDHTSFISLKDQFIKHTGSTCVDGRDRMMCMELVGNIYENPELLKAESNV